MGSWVRLEGIKRRLPRIRKDNKRSSWRERPGLFREAFLELRNSTLLIVQILTVQNNNI
jgi:hypothetical protein